MTLGIHSPSHATELVSLTEEWSSTVKYTYDLVVQNVWISPELILHILYNLRLLHIRKEKIYDQLFHQEYSLQSPVNVNSSNKADINFWKRLVNYIKSRKEFPVKTNFCTKWLFKILNSESYQALTLKRWPKNFEKIQANDWKTVHQS